MFLEVLKSKIHNAVVTDTKLDYEGSITIDEKIYLKAKMHVYEKVLVVNLNNGHRFETYVIKGEKGSKEVCLNGASARLAHRGDRIIIMTFATLDEKEIQQFQPTIICLNDKNDVI